MSRLNGHCSHGHLATPVPVETYLPETELEYYKKQPGYPSTGYLVDVAVGCKLCDGAVSGVAYKPGPPQELANAKPQPPVVANQADRAG